MAGWASSVHENLLLYGTGGLAYGKADHKLSDNCPGCVGGFTGLSGFTRRATKAGWTAGGGAEYLHDIHWFLRAEALYVDLGSETQSIVCPACWGPREQSRIGTISSGSRGSESAYKFGTP